VKILKRFQNKFILTATIGNIITILSLLGVIDTVKADLVTKIVGLVILTLVQIGIVTSPDNSEGGINGG
jgi:uncharacterized membrane protein